MAENRTLSRARLFSLTIPKCSHNENGTKKITNVDNGQTFKAIFNAHLGQLSLNSDEFTITAKCAISEHESAWHEVDFLSTVYDILEIFPIKFIKFLHERKEPPRPSSTLV